MKIKEVLEKVGGLPDIVNIVINDEHVWIGNRLETPEQYLNMKFDESCLHTQSDKPCIIFYVKESK